jgi:hypothetical protein
VNESNPRSIAKKGILIGLVMLAPGLVILVPGAIFLAEFWNARKKMGRILGILILLPSHIER